MFCLFVCLFRFRETNKKNTAACDPRSVRTVTARVRFSEAGEVWTTLSRPGRAVARRADGDVPFDGARTRDCLPSQLGRTTGGSRGRPAFSPVEPPISLARARASVWPSIRYTTLRQAWPGTRGSPRPQCAFDWSMFV